MEKLEQPAEVDAAAASGAPEPVKPVAVIAEPKKPAAAPVVAAPETGEYRGSKWLLAQPADKFTLQLVTVSSAERARVFVAAQPDPDDFAVYQLRRDGRVLHVVVYGLFNTRSEADAAARRLPASVGQVKPWIRSIEQVHGAIATMQ
jgi:DamX protein